MPYTKLGALDNLDFDSDKFTIDNTCLILSLNNVVYIMSDVVFKDSYSSGSTIFNVPASMRPSQGVELPVVVRRSNGYDITALTIKTDGDVFIETSAETDDVLKTSGMMYNIMSKYYNAAIGNNFPQGSTPLDW